MTTKTLSERLTEVKALVEGIERDMKTVPVSDGQPAMGQEYWFIDGCGNILLENWAGAHLDRGRLAIGNVHLTIESAERENERRKVIEILRDMAGGFKPDWSNKDQRKYCISFDHEDGKWLVESFWTTQIVFVLPFFDASYKAEAAIAHLGDRLNVLREE